MTASIFAGPQIFPGFMVPLLQASEFLADNTIEEAFPRGKGTMNPLIKVFNTALIVDSFYIQEIYLNLLLRKESLIVVNKGSAHNDLAKIVTFINQTQ